MKIERINVYRVDLPLKEGRYAWADGKYVEVFDCTIVEIETDEGVSGYGEVCPLGPFYLPAYGPGARTGIGELAPHLIGADPTKIGKINLIMDTALLGHPYVKSAIDMACWDLLGKQTGLPICDLLGGVVGQPSDAVANVQHRRRERRFARQAIVDRRHGVAHVDEFGSLLGVDTPTASLPVAAMNVDDQRTGTVIFD